MDYIKQNWVNILLLVAYGVVAYWVMGKILNRRKNKENKKVIKVITAEIFAKQMVGQQIVDISKPNEFAQEKIKGARNIPLSSSKHAGTLLVLNRPIYIYSRNGRFCKTFANRLTLAGAQDIYILKKGLKEYPYDTIKKGNI